MGEGRENWRGFPRKDREDRVTDGKKGRREEGKKGRREEAKKVREKRHSFAARPEIKPLGRATPPRPPGDALHLRRPF